MGYGTADDESCVAENRDLVRQELDLEPERILAATLSHGTEVAVFRAENQAAWPVRPVPVRRGSSRTTWTFDADAAISDVQGLHFLLTFADCVPLLFVDPVRRAMGVAHAGWRGTAAGMAAAVVCAMTREFGSSCENIHAAIGPSIGPCCYAVRDDVVASFHAHRLVPVMRGKRLDLWSSTVRQLQSAGVRTIEVAGVCTCCNNDTFFSHRGEGGLTGRFAMVAGLGA